MKRSIEYSVQIAIKCSRNLICRLVNLLLDWFVFLSPVFCGCFVVIFLLVFGSDYKHLNQTTFLLNCLLT